MLQNSIPPLLFGSPSLQESTWKTNKLFLIKKELAPRAGFEPATNRLTAGCSTAELPGNGAQ